MTRTQLLLLVCFFASACAAPANPPSLLPRAIETQALTTEPAPPPVLPGPIDAGLAKKIAVLLEEARSGDQAFVSAERSGAAALSAGHKAALGSESWIAAELVRSALQVARQRSAGALSEIDSLAITQGELASRNASIGGVSDIQLAQTEIEAIVSRQTARLDALNP